MPVAEVISQVERGDFVDGRIAPSVRAHQHGSFIEHHVGDVRADDRANARREHHARIAAAAAAPHLEHVVIGPE